jgi:hypothetical protein
MNRRAQLMLLVGLVAGVAVGGLVGFFIGVGSASEGPRPAVTAAEVPDTPPPKRDAAPVERPAPVVAPDRDDPEPRDVSVQAWLDSIPADGPKPGNGRIWGVALSDDQPVAGVVVRARPHYSGPQLHEGATTAEQVEFQARMLLYRDRGTVETVTDAQGRYTLSGLGANHYEVFADKDGYRLTRRHSGVQPGTELTLTLEAIGYVVLDIQRTDGSRPEYARVQVAPGRGTRIHHWNPAHRELPMHVGEVSFTVTVTDSDPQEVSVEVEAGQRLHYLLELQTIGRIAYSVNVSGVDRQQYRHFTVSLVSDPQPGPPTRDEESSSRGAGATPAVFPNLEPGRYRVLLSVGSHILDWKDVDVADTTVEVELAGQIENLPTDEFIPVRVFGPSGEPLRHVSFMLTAMSETRGGGSRSSSGGTADVVTVGDGLYWLKRRPFRGDDLNWYNVTATSQAYGSLDARYNEEDSHVLEFRFQAAGKVIVQVPGAETHRFRSRLNIILFADADPENPFGSVETIQPDGRDRRPGARQELQETLTFSGLQPGPRRLVLVLDAMGGRASRHNFVLSVPLDIGPGEITHVFRLPELYEVTVVPVDGQPNRGSIAGAGRSVNFNASTGPTVAGLFTAGQYVIRSHNGRVRFTVAGDMEVKLEFELYSALVLSRVGDEGHAYDLGLRDGDLVIAVDGNDPRDAQKLRELVRESVRLESTTWTVIRDDAYVNVTMSGVEIGVLRADFAFQMMPAHRD